MPPPTARPPPFDGWDRDLLFELNHTVDIHALSRDVPRLKIYSPRKHSVRDAALQKSGGAAAATAAASPILSSPDSGPKNLSAVSPFVADQGARADNMCAALLYLEELCGNGVPTAPTPVHRDKTNAPDDFDSAPSASPAVPPAAAVAAQDGKKYEKVDVAVLSPLRRKSEELYAGFQNDADLSGAFMKLLRACDWIPSEEVEQAINKETGFRQGKIPAERLPPHVRILGALAQTVMFAPSRRIAHLLWAPFAAHLRDVDWEVFMRTDPWPSSSSAPASPPSAVAATNSSSTPKDQPRLKSDADLTERSPLLTGGADGGAGGSSRKSEEDDDDEVSGFGVVPGGNQSPPARARERAAARRKAEADAAIATAVDTIYVCHRVVSQNVVDRGDVGRHPRFELLWVLELHCSKRTGEVRRARITGTRVRLLDDEAVIAGSCGCTCCGASAEWYEHKAALQTLVRDAFGIELEAKGAGQPF